jgi:hypothetical protein
MSEMLERVLRVRMWSVARRAVWRSVYAAGFADGKVRREGRDCVERV